MNRLAVYRRPEQPRKPRHRPLELTDARVREILGTIRRVEWVNGVAYPYTYIRDARTRNGTLAWVVRHPFNPEVERIWAVDFRTGIPRDIGPAHRAQPSRKPRQELLPPPSPQHRLPDNPKGAAYRRAAELLGMALIRRMMK